MPTSPEKTGVPRPPIIVIMGHIDHGKSSLLDYIRKTNVVAGEAGGITQHLGAYEASWNNKQITFIDTPGHAAFTGMRERGAQVADIAILIISAVEGVQAQTLEALETIKKAKLPYIVALNKVDRPEANPDRVKQQLLEHEVFVEGYGGSVPWVALSAKSGQSVDELLDTILLVAEVEDFRADPHKNAEGFVIESHLDTKRGAAGTLIVRSGTLKTGSSIVIAGAVSPVRILENFLGKPIKEAGPSHAVKLYSLVSVPPAGSEFVTFEKKKEAEDFAESFRVAPEAKQKGPADEEGRVYLPLIIKTDAAGTLEAVVKEIGKLATEAVGIKIVGASTGPITENDIKLALGAKSPIVLGFHTKIEKAARDLADAHTVQVLLFDIIYKATEALADEVQKRTPKVTVEETTAKAKVLKLFSKEKDRQVLGGAVLSGTFAVGKQLKLMRQEHEIGRGRVVELQHMKQKAKEVEASKQFGALIESKMMIAEGDILELFEEVVK